VKRGRGKLLATISSSTPRAQTKPHKEGKSPLMDSARITTSQHNLTKPCLDKPRDHNIKNRKFQSTGAELSRLSHDLEEDFLPVRRRCPGLAGSSVLRDLGFLPLHPHDVEEDFLPVVVPRSSLHGSQRSPSVRAFPSWSLTSASASSVTKTVRPPRPEASKGRNEHKQA
jgi:hypothetical protein